MREGVSVEGVSGGGEYYTPYDYFGGFGRPKSNLEIS